MTHFNSIVDNNCSNDYYQFTTLMKVQKNGKSHYYLFKTIDEISVQILFFNLKSASIYSRRSQTHDILKCDEFDIIYLKCIIIAVMLFYYYLCNLFKTCTMRNKRIRVHLSRITQTKFIYKNRIIHFFFHYIIL